jgi:hypothetical protein
MGMRNWILWVTLLGSPAMAQDACQIAASARTGSYMKVPIHAAPTSTSEVLEVAPEYRDEATGRVLGARFVVVEMRNGWARVTNVTDWSRTVSASDGWIGAINIALAPQTYRGFAVASPSSKLIWEGTNWPAAEVLIDCKGEWGKVRLRTAEAAESVTAWVRGFCDNQADICEGVGGDGGS